MKQHLLDRSSILQWIVILLLGFWAGIQIPGCGSTSESYTSVRRDTTIVLHPQPIYFDSTLGRSNFGSAPQCDTAMILKLYGSFHVEHKDSTLYYRLKWNAAERRLEFLEERQPEIHVIPIMTKFESKKTTSPSWIEIMGYGACGAMTLAGILFFLKGFKVF